MKRWMLLAALAVGAVWGPVLAADEGGAATRPATQSATTVAAACPGLATGVLTHARLTDLPEGVLVKSGTVTLLKAELDRELAEADEFVKPQLEKQAFFLAERLATRRLLAAAARTAPATTRPAKADDDLIDALLDPIVERVKVAEAEVRAFYEANLEAVGGAPFKDVQPQIEAYLLNEKRGQAVDDYVRTLGERMEIQVSAAWAKAQVAPARDNPIDRVRWAGKTPTVVAFGSPSCCGPDQTQPLVEELAERLKTKATVLYVDGKQEMVLAARYGVEGFPTFLVFDARGGEIARRSGRMEEQEIVALLARAGGR
jgi:thiol-disulfide isomerase/thioredoxin